MRIITVILIAIFLAATPVALPAEEENENIPKKALLEGNEIEVSADIAVNSKYIWRGFKLDDDPVMQPGVYLGGYGFEASIWGSFDIDNNDALDSDEVDYAVSYTLGLERYLNIPMSVSGGYTYYDFVGARLHSQEFFIGTSFDILLSPSFTWYHDFEDEDKGGGKGDYIVGELSHSYPIGGYPVSLDLSGHVGYNHRLFIKGNGGDVGLGAGLTFNLSRNCLLSPSIGILYLLVI